jgi:protein phosphatase
VACGCCSINGYRNTMEDAHMMQATGERMLFGVFDGHSNDKCSNYVAEHMPHKLNALPPCFTNDQLEKVCIDLDAQFLEDVGDGGSTGTFVIIETDAANKKYNVIVANVGDSRTILARDEKILFATADHKPQNPDERSRIERCGGTVRMNRVDGDLAVSRAFGDGTFKRHRDGDLRNQKVIAVPDITRHECVEGDVIIIACDGVFEGAYSNEEVVQTVYSLLPPPGGDYAVICARVCDQAVRRGSKDNISCMIVQFTNGQPQITAHGPSAFVPGSPFPKTHEASKTAYSRMAQLAGLSLVEALQARWELFQAYQKNTISQLPQIQQVAFEMCDEVDIETERIFFGNGPQPGNEKAYFAALAEGNR